MVAATPENGSRRKLLQAVVPLLGTYGVLQCLGESRALAAPSKAIPQQWIQQVWEHCRDLRVSRLTPTQWQEHMEALFRRTSLEELLSATDVEHLFRAVTLPNDRLKASDLCLPGLEGIDSKELITTLFAMREGHAIVPHGHHNMASVHVVLRGQLHVRHFERLAETPSHLIIQPSIDTLSRPGDSSSISDERSNVHWLIATHGPAFTLDVIVPGLVGGTAWGRDYIDPVNAEKLPGGKLRAQRVTANEAFRQFGRV